MNIQEAAQKCKVCGYITQVDEDGNQLLMKLWKNTLDFAKKVKHLQRTMDIWECFDPEGKEGELWQQ